ncbi:hypothetical protein VNO77_44552 [Canavalia gladiata]|uniref:Ribosomal protein L31 n=1 Tax=Canavalia gladiata TaxID=3824 RepID=A0AAN9PR52_CANGL
MHFLLLYSKFQKPYPSNDHRSSGLNCISSLWDMKKGVHPQKQWISYVTQTGRLMHVMMTKIHPVGKVYHFRAKRQMAESLGQIAKFRRRFGLENQGGNEK